MSMTMKECIVEAMPYLDRNRVVVRWVDYDGVTVDSAVYIREGYKQPQMFEWDNKSKDWVMLQYDIAHDMGGRWW